jgi:hypothetical protein
VVQHARDAKLTTASPRHLCLSPLQDLYVTSNQSFHSPQVPLVVPPAPQFITKSTLALALHDRRVPEGSRPHGFGSVLHRHDPTRDMHLLETTTHSTYGGKYADSEEKRREGAGLQQVQQSKPAGKVSVDNGSVLV